MDLSIHNLFAFLGISLAVSALLQYLNCRKSSPPPKPSDVEEDGESKKTPTLQLLTQFARFQFLFLAVFLLTKMSDWLQGPYVYALYRDYGLSQTDIGILFVAGFGSAGFFGSFIGTVADLWGRRLVCLIFCAAYAAACMTKHFNNFKVLMLGRLLGGLATAILFSVFDTWMVHEHHARQFKEDWIAETFTRATFFDGAVAIVAGLIASIATYQFGMVAPFDVAFICLVAAAVLIWWTWNENYGDPKRGSGESAGTSAGAGISDVMSKIYESCKEDSRIVWVGVIQSFFEGAMYTFVFMWTPSLPNEINHGTVFAIFMTAITIGSAIFTQLQSRFSLPAILVGMCVCAAGFLAVPVFSASPLVRLAAFVLFEVCCGVYFPAFYTLRSRIVPDAVRASVLNLYRVPLNVIVIFVCVFGEQVGVPIVFATCTTLLQLAAYAAWMVHRATPPTKQGQVSEEEAEMVKT